MNRPSDDAISAMIPLPEGYRAERLIAFERMRRYGASSFRASVAVHRSTQSL